MSSSPTENFTKIYFYYLNFYVLSLLAHHSIRSFCLHLSFSFRIKTYLRSLNNRESKEKKKKGLFSFLSLLNPDRLHFFCTLLTSHTDILKKQINAHFGTQVLHIIYSKLQYLLMNCPHAGFLFFRLLFYISFRCLSQSKLLVESSGDLQFILINCPDLVPQVCVCAAAVTEQDPG